MGRNNIPSLITVAAWASITVIAYATLTHVGFVYSIYFKLMPFLMQPAMINYAHFEHIICFALVGVLFGIAYPRRAILVCCIILGGAALLEILQTLTPDRHGTLVDALEKMAGGAAGIFFAKCALQLAGRHRVSWNRSHDFRQPKKNLGLPRFGSPVSLRTPSSACRRSLSPDGTRACRHSETRP